MLLATPLTLFLSQEFLFYHQKECEMGEDPNAASTPWAQMIRLALLNALTLSDITSLLRFHLAWKSSFERIVVT
jgi:hypothetical protein